MSNLGDLNFALGLGNYLDKDGVISIIGNLSIDSLSVILDNLKSGSKEFLSYILTNKVLSIESMCKLCAKFDDLDNCKISARNRLKIIEGSEDIMSLNFTLKFFGGDMVVCKLEDINEPEDFLKIVRHSANYDYDSFLRQLQYLITYKMDSKELNDCMYEIIDRFSYFGLKDKHALPEELITLLEEFEKRLIKKDI